jgi:hypothetical protein
MCGLDQTWKDQHGHSTAGQPPTAEMFEDRPAPPVSANTKIHLGQNY